MLRFQHRSMKTSEKITSKEEETYLTIISHIFVQHTEKKNVYYPARENHLTQHFGECEI